MQRILGYMRKTIQKYGMLEDGDVVGVGVSGGKDSMVLLYGLHLLSRFIGIDYKVIGITVDPGFGGTPGDYTEAEDFCRTNGIPYHVIRTQIGEIVFDVRKDKNPCSICAHLRRGALQDAARDLGCTKLALGHNHDDTIETFIMNLFNEGRIGCYSPVTELEDKGMIMIRPLVMAPEKEVRRAARRAQLPIVKSKCPADGHTNRQKTKEFLAEMERKDHGFKDRMYTALCNSGIDGWKR